MSIQTWPRSSVALRPWPMDPRLRNSKPRLRWLVDYFGHLVIIRTMTMTKMMMMMAVDSL